MNYEATQFFGRKDQLAELEARLCDSHRLLTVTGAPGVGKSCLVREFLRRRYSGASDAVVVNLCGADGSKAEALLSCAEEELGQTNSLIFVDDCEAHLSLISDAVLSWLDGFGQLRIILATREALGLMEESRLHLPPLAMEDARRLYFDAARRAGVSSEEGGRLQLDVELLVERLGGLALAVELAGLQAASYSPRELVDRRPELLDLLRMERASRDGRHQSLRLLIEASWEQLDDGERDMLRKLAIFDGGFDHRSALEICAVDESEFGRLLKALQRKSLVGPTKYDGVTEYTRFEMPEIVRLFALEKSAEDRKTHGEICGAHRRYFAGIYVPQELDEGVLFDPRQIAWLLRERHNFDAALEWALEAGDWDQAARLLFCLGELGHYLGPMPGFEQHVDEVVSRCVDEGLDELAGPLFEARGEWHKFHGRLDEAYEDWSSGLAWAEKSGDVRLASWLLLRMGAVATFQSGWEDAEQHLSQGLQRSRQHGLAELERLSHAYLASLYAECGRVDEAEAQLHLLADLPSHREVRKEFEALRAQIYARFHIFDDVQMELLVKQVTQLVGQGRMPLLRANYWRLLADCAYVQRDLEVARRHYLQSMELLTELEVPYLEGVVTGSLGGVCLSMGELDEALQWYERSILRHREAGLSQQITKILMAMASIYHQQGRHGLAERQYREMVELARHRGGSPFYRGVTWMLRSWNALEAGHPGAVDFCRKALSILESIHEGYTCFSHLTLAIAEAAAGERCEARKTWEEAQRRLEDYNSTTSTNFREYFRLLETLWGLYESAPPGASSLDNARELVDEFHATMDQRREGTSPMWAVLLGWLERTIRRLQESAGEERSSEAPHLRVGVGATSFQFDDGEEVDLSRRSSLRRILKALVDHKSQQAGQSLSIGELFEVGWPGETIQQESVQTRVYWAIYTLRKLGLESVLLTGGDGYMLSPDLVVEAKGEDSRGLSATVKSE